MSLAIVTRVGARGDLSSSGHVQPELLANSGDKYSVLNNFSALWILSHWFWSPEQMRGYVLKTISKSSVQLK